MEYLIEEYGIAMVVLLVGTAIVLGFCTLFYAL